MSQENQTFLNKNNFGIIKISENVVADIAGLAVNDIDGVAGMSGGISSGINDLLGRRNLSKGVNVFVGEKEASIDLNIVINFGTSIPEVSKLVQEKVKKNVEDMTGLDVVEVNVNIEDVVFDKIEKENTIGRVR